MTMVACTTTLYLVAPGTFLLAATLPPTLPPTSKLMSLSCICLGLLGFNLHMSCAIRHVALIFSIEHEGARLIHPEIFLLCEGQRLIVHNIVVVVSKVVSVLCYVYDCREFCLKFSELGWRPKFY